MSVREFLTNVAILSTIMAIASLVETAVPMFSCRSADSTKTSSFPGLLSMPFETRDHQSVPDTKVRIQGSAGR